MAAITVQARTAGECSHIPLIPLLTAYLVWNDRTHIFVGRPFSVRGVYVIVLALILYFVFGRGAPLYWQAIAVVLYICGAFIAVYGWQAWRSARGRMLLLLLAIPLPYSLLGSIVSVLQNGSAAFAGTLLRVSGMPFQQEGLTLRLPLAVIQVARSAAEFAPVSRS